MVDVGGKSDTVREALAEAWIDLPGELYRRLSDEGVVAKGDPFRIA